MKPLNITAALAFVFLVAGCSSGPPVRRSPGFGPQQPTPTLAAAAIYDYYVPVEEVNLSHLDFTSFSSASVKNASVDPLAVAGAIGDIMDKMSVYQLIEESGPGLHAKVPGLLKDLGFQLEFDGARATELSKKGDYSYVAPETAAHPFDEFPIFGPGSKSSVARSLKTGREREAYASIHAVFDSKNDDIDNGMSCELSVRILNQEGDLVFDGKTRGFSKASAGLHGLKIVERAFDKAAELMRTTVVEES